MELLQSDVYVFFLLYNPFSSKRIGRTLIKHVYSRKEFLFICKFLYAFHMPVLLTVTEIFRTLATTMYDIPAVLQSALISVVFKQLY